MYFLTLSIGWDVSTAFKPKPAPLASRSKALEFQTRCKLDPFAGAMGPAQEEHRQLWSGPMLHISLQHEGKQLKARMFPVNAEKSGLPG
jgi:hypothetical protein